MSRLSYISILVLSCFVIGIGGCSQVDDEQNKEVVEEVQNGLDFQKDVIETNIGELVITFVGHGTLMFVFDEKVIHVDPVASEADYSIMPKADIVLVTHEHGDHFDPKSISAIRQELTDIVLTESCRDKIEGSLVMDNGDVRTFKGIKVEAVPAYNLKHKRASGEPFHPKGRGNGYILTFGDKRVYIAGDTENIPEMKELANIDIAFLPMNLPYTMTPEMVADAAKSFKPTLLYPYHYGKTDPGLLVELLKDSGMIEVRVRNMQ